MIHATLWCVMQGGGGQGLDPDRGRRACRSTVCSPVGGRCCPRARPVEKGGEGGGEAGGGVCVG